MFEHRLDADTKHAVDVLSMMIPFGEAADRQRLIVSHRKDMVDAGLAAVPPLCQEILRDYEDLLRFRWSFDHFCWVVDRWVKEQKAWVTVLRWLDENGHPKLLGTWAAYEIVDTLRAHDMQRWSSPEAYLKHKRELAQKKQIENDKKGTDHILEVIDRMSDKQVQTYIDAHRAMHTGEKIIAHGNDEKFLERTHELTKQREAEGKGQIHAIPSMNPGMNPLTYHRKDR